jgi:hypothetical protein
MTAQLPIQKERLEGIARGEKCYTHDDVVQVVRALLAAHEQEPATYMCDGDDGREYNGHNEFSCGGPGIPLYTHPAPVPAVPDERTWLFYCEKYPEMPMGDAIIRAVEWNACRAAMLNGGKS